MVAVHRGHAADLAGVQADEGARWEDGDLREKRLDQGGWKGLVLGAHDLADRLVRSEARPRRRRQRERRVGVDQAQDLGVRVHGGPVEALRETLPLFALVMLEHRLDDLLVRRGPAADPLDRQPRVRAVETLLLRGQRVEPAREALGQLPEPDVDQAAGHAELHPPRPIVPDTRADGDPERRDARLVESQVIDAGERDGIVGHPEELTRPLQRHDAALDEVLQLRPRERVAGADDLADARQEKLELRAERFRALAGWLRQRRLERQRVEARRRLDGGRRLDPRRGRGPGHLRNRARPRRPCRRVGRRRSLDLVRRLLADDTAHDVAHAHHQETPTMSLITSAMIFSPISFTRFEYPTSRATSHRLLISRGVPRVKSKTSLIASSVKSWLG